MTDSLDSAALPRTARRPPRNGVPFSQADSLLLLRFDSQGVKRKDMAERLGRTLGSINGHLQRLKKGKVDLNVVDEEEEGATEVAASGGEASSSWESSENESEEEEAPEDDYEQPSEPRRRRASPLFLAPRTLPPLINLFAGSVTASKPRTRPSARFDSTSCTPRVRYTPADDLKLVKLYKTGQKWPKIGEALGRTAASVGGRYRYLEQTGKLPKVGRRTAG